MRCKPKPIIIPFDPAVEDRREILVWMMRQQWRQSVIDEIMYRDNPTPDKVRRLVHRLGVDRAYMILSNGVE